MKWKSKFLKGITAFKEVIMPVRAGQNMTQEIATRERSIDYFSQGFYLPNPDPVLKAMGKDIEAYTDIKSDGFVSGCIRSRKAGVLKQFWGIDRGKARSRQVKVIDDCFQRMDMKRIFGEMLEGGLFGYAVLEVLWELRDNMWLPRDIVGKPQRWFVYGDKNDLLHRTRGNWNGEPVPEYRFLVARNQPTFDNPYGIADLGRCWWAGAFKRNGMAFFATFIEKYGMPFLVGKLPRNFSPKEYDDLSVALQNMIRDAIAVVPSDASVEIPSQGSNSSAAKNYTDMIDTCKKEISVVMLGHEGAAQSTSGKLGSDDVAMKVMDNIVDMDTDMITAQMRVLIDWIYDINFGQGERPLFSMWLPEAVQKEVADRDKIHHEMGVRHTKEYFVETFGLKEEHFDLVEEKKEAPPPGPAAAAKFREMLRFAKFREVPATDEALLDQALNLITPEQLQGFSDGLLKPIWELIETGADPEAVAEKLAETYPDMEDAKFQETMTSVFFVTGILARLRVNPSVEA